MGSCQGNRNSYTNPMQKACTACENTFRLYHRDWKMMVAAIRSFCPEDGTVPPTAIRRIMQEMGMCSTYDDKAIRLKELINEYLKDANPQQTWLIYFALFMCDGNEAAKMEYLCWTMNGMDMQKTTVSGERFKDLLKCLMKLATQTIPSMGEIKDHKEEISKQPLDEAVTKWCPDCVKENLTIDEVRAWGVKCHNFTPGEARSAMLKLVAPEPAPKQQPPKQQEPTTVPSKDNPKVEKTSA